MLNKDKQCLECGEPVEAKDLCKKHYNLFNVRRWAENNPEKHRANQGKRKLDPSLRMRDKITNHKGKLLRKYGLTLDDFNTMLMEQNNKCKLCGWDHMKNDRSLHVDHCHDTGRVRGLLCFRCNYGIGYFGDNVEKFKQVVEYLEGTLK